MAEDTPPADMETKDTRGTLLGYIPSTVPHISRTGSELTDDERKRADDRLRQDGTGVAEDEHKRSQFGIGTDSGGTQSEPVAGTTENAGTVKPAKRSGSASS